MWKLVQLVLIKNVKCNIKYIISNLNQMIKLLFQDSNSWAILPNNNVDIIARNGYIIISFSNNRFYNKNKIAGGHYSKQER